MSLHESYSQSGAADIRSAFGFTRLEPCAISREFIEASTRDRIIRVTENDGTFEVFLFSSNYLQVGKATLSGSLANPVTLAIVITEVAQQAREEDAA